MTRRVLAVGGPPGSGKSTAGRLVAEAMGLEFRSAGEEFRREGRARGMDVEAFGRFAESHPEIDRDLDTRMLGLATPGRLLEGRLTGPLCRRHQIAVRYVVVTASEDVRVHRIAQRDGLSYAVAQHHVRARAASERQRYLGFYGIDVEREVADVTIDSTVAPASEVAGAIVAFVKERDASEPP